MLGQKIQIDTVESLELPPLEYDLGESVVSRKVKVFMVPEKVSSDRYFISLTEPGGKEVLPPCRIKDTRLLLDYTLNPNGEVNIHYIDKEVKKCLK